MTGRLLCLRCKQFIERVPAQTVGLGKCKAFPDGIPYDVFAYINYDNKPKICNNGVGFESDDNDD